MKIAMSFTLNHTLVSLLQGEKNASALVNDLLEQHYGSNHADFDRKLAEYRREIKKIKQMAIDFDQNEREKYIKLLQESERKNTKLAPEVQEELNILHKKYRGKNVRK